MQILSLSCLVDKPLQILFFEILREGKRLKNVFNVLGWM